MFALGPQFDESATGCNQAKAPEPDGEFHPLRSLVTNPSHWTRSPAFDLRYGILLPNSASMCVNSIERYSL